MHLSTSKSELLARCRRGKNLPSSWAFV